MKTSIRIFLFSLGAGLMGLWPAGADAQTGALGLCELASPGGILGLAPGGAAARTAMIKRTVKCLQATGQTPASGSAGVGGQFVTFDPPGSTLTNPTGIAPDRAVIGSYCNTAACTAQSGFVGAHGFLRSWNGSFTSFDPPGSTQTLPTSIAPTGEIAGGYFDASGTQHGFVRARDGTFTTFDAPGVSSSIDAPLYGSSGPSPDINPPGAIAGTYFDASFNEHGFLRAKNGALTTIDFPGDFFTEVIAINPSGVIAGDFCNATTCYTGFKRFPTGNFTAIDIPGGACGGQSIPFDINPSGVVIGSFTDPTCNNVVHGYVWSPDGKVTAFDVPGSRNTGPIAINPAGSITGLVILSGFHGFLRTPNGDITTFDPPGSSFTVPTGISPAGAIIGLYDDATGQHGFLRLP
jgi:hypothetical protein